jgi:hypothetical protein
MISIIRCFEETLKVPPEIGSVLTVKHTGYYSNGRLRDPLFWRERDDINWAELSMKNSNSN